jgi:uncharacterized protein YbjT (DUF2867 family)
MQNFLRTSAPRPDGAMYAPLEDSKTAYIDVRDIADVATRCLTESGHEGKAYTLTGPEAIGMQEVAAILSDVTGRSIRYVNIPESAAREAMHGANMPAWMVDMILDISATSRNGHAASVTPTVREVTGNPARTFRQFAQDNAKAWKSR